MQTQVVAQGIIQSKLLLRNVIHSADNKKRPVGESVGGHLLDGVIRFGNGEGIELFALIRFGEALGAAPDRKTRIVINIVLYMYFIAILRNSIISQTAAFCNG